MERGKFQPGDVGRTYERSTASYGEASSNRGLMMRVVPGKLAAALVALVLWSAAAGADAADRVKSGALGDAPVSGYFTPSIAPKFQAGLVTSKELLSDSDKSVFESAYDAANRRDWTLALSYTDRIHNKIAAKLINWAYLIADETTPSFDDLVRFIDANPNWPLQDVLLEKAEKALPGNMPPARLIAWFAGQEPLTGEGILRLGEALLATGEKDYGARWIVLAWSEHDFSDQEQALIYASHKDILSGQPTVDRVNHLLWSSQYDQAQQLLSELPGDVRRIAEARIALLRQASDAMTYVKALPKSQQSDPAIIFDSARYLRRMGKDDDARAMLLTLKDPEKAPFPEKWWIERSYEARQALQDQNYEGAYALLDHTGLTARTAARLPMRSGLQAG